ncbi:MAG: nickel pincer cofactor biosynthesis protein LarC [Planctomycetota bacterium]
MIGYFDCFSGAAGDMILGALVAAGFSPDSLRAELAKLDLDGYELTVRDVREHGFAAKRVDVLQAGKTHHRHLPDILKLIHASDLSDRVKDRARRIFGRLAEAEAKVHGTSVDEIHFHEVGAIDAIVDIVGASIGVEQLSLDRIVCSPVPVGSGTVTCEHGVLPVPAPATAELLTGVPLADCDEPGELTTPTGAAILTVLADAFGPLPAMKIERCVCGAGSRQGRTRPNLLRLIVGQEMRDDPQADQVVVLEVNLDDATGEQIGHAFGELFAAGALDVFTTPIMMKKNRPGVMLSVLTTPDKQRACEEAIFAETTTFGIRSYACNRRKLARAIETVQTRFGEIRIKVGLSGGRAINAAPEYDDCAEAARRHGVPLGEVVLEAQHAWRDSRGRTP